VKDRCSAFSDFLTCPNQKAFKMVSSSALPHRRRSLVATLYLALCALALALPAAVAVAEEVSIDAAGQVEPVSQEDESTAHVNKVTIAAEDAAIPVEGVYQLEDAVEPRDSVQPDHVNQVDEVNTATPVSQAR
jgi:hypothetical protein